MFCPECGLEYEEGSEEGISHCIDCEVALVDEPEEEEGGEEADFVPILEVTDVAAFALVTSRLEEEGIPWFVQSEPPSGMPAESAETAAVATVAIIYVAENRLPEARRILEEATPVGVDEKS
jgi:hypothetical protein